MALLDREQLRIDDVASREVRTQPTTTTARLVLRTTCATATAFLILLLPLLTLPVAV